MARNAALDRLTKIEGIYIFVTYRQILDATFYGKCLERTTNLHKTMEALMAQNGELYEILNSVTKDNAILEKRLVAEFLNYCQYFFKMFQNFFKNVSKIFQICFKKVSKIFQNFSKNVLKIFQKKDW